jgi:replication initiation and membrane attachment protein DnaB
MHIGNDLVNNTLHIHARYTLSLEQITKLVNKTVAADDHIITQYLGFRAYHRY